MGAISVLVITDLIWRSMTAELSVYCIEVRQFKDWFSACTIEFSSVHKG